MRSLKGAAKGKGGLPEELAPKKFCFLGLGQGLPEKSLPTASVEVRVKRKKKPGASAQLRLPKGRDLSPRQKFFL